jgi:hypothetical protein
MNARCARAAGRVGAPVPFTGARRPSAARPSQPSPHPAMNARCAR